MTGQWDHAGMTLIFHSKGAWPPLREREAIISSCGSQPAIASTGLLVFATVNNP